MKVCIIGDGLSSLTLAKILVNQNIYVDVLSQIKHQKFSKSRTIGISKNNIDFFNKNIINIKKLLWGVQKIEIYTDNLKKQKLLNFENKDQLFSIVKNHELYSLIEKNLTKNKFFKKKLLFKKKLFPTNKYDLIINCDYFNPFTAKYFSKKIIKKYNSFSYTTIIEHENIKNNIATQIFTKKGPLAFLPISNNETSIVYSIHHSNDKIKENILELIKNYNFKYKIKKIDRIDRIELSSLNLRTYFNNNILAFGDLLHRIHPLAGQGYNMTIRDIKILIHIIKNKIDLGLPLDSSVNDEFERRSKHNNFIFSTGIDLVHKFFNMERKTKNDILSKSVQYIGKNSTLNKILVKIADKGILL